ncbi:MAG: thioesterase [Chloroflexi bacterium AL-W]|nr:thioesterase [Chloroflexi bacterium AL-N1]NOK67291.1 thioesterase [Chloroflexi bacterium AL-N10]NOK75215.1 thioesterase [Chloroflexi bacterium AL-N5]NOK82003.1 thioesterase [Chloroflexi bacterium AL-W]NOK89848.1 thioesterase [Chloroflexi bacterium AL-N15]
MASIGKMAADNWLFLPKPNPYASLRMFCFSHAGSDAFAFKLWPDILPSQVELCAVQLPGRTNRLHEPAFTNMSALLDALLTALLEMLDRPFVVYGHSLGALIGFEFVRHLRQQSNRHPLHLFVSGRRAPHLPSRMVSMAHLPHDDFITELRKLNGTPEAILEHPELVQMLVPLLRSDLSLHETYTYTTQEPLDCPISAFGGLEDPRAYQSEIAEWESYTKSTFTIRMFPGDHFFVQGSREQFLQAIVHELGPYLTEVGERPDAPEQRVQ